MEKLPLEDIKREVLIKKESKTSKEYGCTPENRPIRELINYGIINLNKLAGPTSHQTTDYVKRILNIKRAGHSGSLDPIVTGVLPIALNKATRITQVLLKSGKEYIGIMHTHKKVKEENILKTVEEFVGKIKQLPPVRSAVKRQIRQRTVYYFKILEINDQDVLFRVGCEAGTYIRKLVHDFGLKLGTKAHMSQLIRTKVGPFTDKNWHTLHEVKDAYEFYKQGNEKELRKVILPFESAISHLPKVWVLDTTVHTLCNGADLAIPGISKLESKIKIGDLVAILTLKGELICLGSSEKDSETLMNKEKGIAVKTSKVFMPIKTYQK